MKLLSVLESLVKWLEKNLPGLLVAFSLGFRQGAKKTDELEVELIDAKHEAEKERNKRALIEANKGLDDRTIIRRAIDKSRGILKKGRGLL